MQPVDLSARKAISLKVRGSPGNYVLGANVTGFLRVSQAMVALGLI